MVSFAGMYVEILLAAFAAVIWLATPPSLLNAMMFNVVLLCSVNTLLINGNPLLRYDGYYMLSDWWNKPNLGATANVATTNFWLSWLGFPVQRHTTSTSVLFYGLLSMAYRWFILLAIVGGLVWFVGESGSYPLGYLLGGVLLAGLLLTSIGRSLGMVRSSSSRSGSLIRPAITLVFLSGIGWCLFYLPLPCSVYCDVVAEPTDPARIYATDPGRLELVAKNYATVGAGQVVARIENSSLQRTRQVKQKELEVYEDRIQELQLRFNEEASLAAVINTARQKLQTLQVELKLLDQQIRGLTMQSPVAGIVYPSPARPHRWIDEPTAQSWEGYLNDRKNAGCVVSRGEHILSVCGKDQIGVSLIVGESEIELVEIGQRVKIRFEQLPDQLLVGRSD